MGPSKVPEVLTHVSSVPASLVSFTLTDSFFYIEAQLWGDEPIERYLVAE